MNTDTTTDTTVTVSEYFSVETMSPYGLIKTVNKILADLQIDKTLPGPMGYTYCKKGYIPTIDDAKKVVHRDDAIEWTEKYLAKLVTKITTVTEETVEVEMTEPLPIEV